MKHETDTYDSVYLMEDMKARLALLIATYTREPLTEWLDHRMAYPEMMVREADGMIRSVARTGQTEPEFASAVAAAAEAAIAERAAPPAKTWRGMVRHPYGDSHTGMLCGAMVMRNGGGDQCGLPSIDEVHVNRPWADEMHAFATSPGLAECQVLVMHPTRPDTVDRCGLPMDHELHVPHFHGWNEEE